eukprot:Phypoly_transcript_10263.p1 GENE.Phypoly_transcript_10263~~Phypoly_transcript_10263.p1  ORF type:complete len:351 (+),score=46.45 Phypoly_transcript_10263:239-1291(+)
MSGNHFTRLRDAHFKPVLHGADEQGYSHIVSYNTQSLFNFGFINPAGSVLTWSMAFRALVMCGAATFVSQFRCTGKPHWEFCFPVLANAEGLIFATLVTFLLGTFVTLIFSRWQSIRGGIGTQMTGVLTMNMILEFASPEFQPQKDKIIRWMTLGHKLIYKYATDDFNYQVLIDKGLMTPAENERLLEFRSVYQPAIVFGWVMHTMQPLVRSMPSRAAQQTALACVSNCFTASEEISAFIKTQLSYPYVHLITFITKVHLVLVMIYGGGVVTEGITMHLWNRIALGYIIIITNNIIYEGLLQIYEKLHNPLGHDEVDFPNHMLSNGPMNIGKSYKAIPPPAPEEIFYVKV